MQAALERMRVAEVLVARDASIQHLADANASVRHKATTITSLQAKNARLEQQIVLLEGQLRDDARLEEVYEGVLTRRSSVEWVIFQVLD